MIVEQFDVTRKAAARQLTLHVLPKLTMDGRKFIGTEYREVDGRDNDWIGEQSILPNSSQQQPIHHYHADQNVATQHHHHRQQQYQPKQPVRSIVISGVTSGRGRELFEYFCNQGHNVAGCGVLSSDIRSLKIMFPQSKLNVVNTTEFEAVEQWSSEIAASEMDIDLVIANAEVFPSPQETYRGPAWEVTRSDFDKTMDANVKGLYNMIRNFIPKMIQKSNATATARGVRKERVFVAVSSSFGERLNTFLAAHCASTLAVAGLMRCVAMEIPEPLSAVTFDPSVVEGHVQHDKLVSSVDDEDGHTGEDESKWVNIAAPMLLRMNRGSNGQSMSINS